MVIASSTTQGTMAVSAAARRQVVRLHAPCTHSLLSRSTSLRHATSINKPTLVTTNPVSCISANLRRRPCHLQSAPAGACCSSSCTSITLLKHMRARALVMVMPRSSGDSATTSADSAACAASSHAMSTHSAQRPTLRSTAARAHRQLAQLRVARTGPTPPTPAHAAQQHVCLNP